jgi:hypothetical protein
MVQYILEGLMIVWHIVLCQRRNLARYSTATAVDTLKNRRSRSIALDRLNLSFNLVFDLSFDLIRFLARQEGAHHSSLLPSWGEHRVLTRSKRM